jgi:imidazolonepropionase-like amidohydrolase
MQKVIKIKGLVDVDSGVLVENSFVLIDGETISAVGRQVDMPALDPMAEILDHPDKFALPGLINSHAHLCLPADGRPLGTLPPQSDEIWLLTAAKNARRSLMSGVTTLRDCGDMHGVTFALRTAMEMGITEGPRLILSGPPLTMTGGHAWQWGREVDGADEITKAARLQLKNGADFIKLMATGGGTPGTHPGSASYTVPELAAAVEVAHRIGKTVATHCRGIPGMQNTIEAGVDQMEHACCELPDGTLKFDPRLAEKIADAGMVVTPTIRLYKDWIVGINQKKEKGEISPEEEERLQLMPYSYEEKLTALNGFLEAGVRCVAGNDAGLPFTRFDRFWQELESMVEGGMTCMQAITAATKTPAEAMNLAQDIGSLKMGKQADIIVVDDDPTANVAALAKVVFVMKAGEIYRDSCASL